MTTEMREQENTQQQEENTEFSAAFAKAAQEKASDSEGDTPAVDGQGMQAGENGNADDGNSPGEDGEGEGNDDPYAGLPPEAVERIKAAEAERDELRHQVSSGNGRVSALQRKLNDLERQIQQASAAQSAAGNDAPSEQQIAEAMETPEKWEDFKDEYPEIADAIDSRLAAALNQHQSQLDQRLAPVIETVHEQKVLTGYEELEQIHPGWRDRVATDDFQSWLEQQPEAVQAWADSDDVNEASSLIGYYDQYLLATGRDIPTPTSTDSGGGEKPAATLEERRAQQLEDGQTLPSTGAGVTTDGPETGDEFSRAFQAEARKRQQARQATA